MTSKNTIYLILIISHIKIVLPFYGEGGGAGGREGEREYLIYVESFILIKRGEKRCK